MKRRLLWTRFATFTIATMAAIICASVGLSKLTAILAFVLAAAPLIILDLLWPPPIDISGTQDDLEFEFRDSNYAAEFAHLNGIQPDQS